MRYERVCAYVAAEVWAILPGKLAEIVSALAFKASGGDFTPEEIQARIGDRGAPGAAPSGRGVAVIPIRGTIAHRGSGLSEASGGTSTEAIGRALSLAASDDSVGTIVYDIDSPGGTVTGVAELADRMFALRGVKKQIAHVNGMMASAAYWLGAQADEIVSLPSGTSGSIGVFAAHQDLSKALEQAGVNVTLISAGRYKTEGNPFEPLSDDAKTFLQERVDDAYGQFVKAVARGRGVGVADVKEGFGQGRALIGKDAKAAGLVDRLATFEDTVTKALGRSGSVMRAEAVTPESDRRRRLERF